MKHTIFYFILGGIVLGVGFFVLSNGNPQPFVVELQEEGFFPRELIIHKGDRVIFTTIQDRPFWPASSIHPTHTIYTEFDPKKPIEPKEIWSFRFKEVGIWEYHNHLFPLYTGSIIVLEKGKETSSVRQDSSCVDGGGNQAQCWEQLIEDTVEKKGIDEAFEVIASLYATEPIFARDCHGYVHELGEEAYKKFSQGEKFEVSPKTSYCGYGFYHGFMETLLLTTGDIKQGQEFCKYIDQQLYTKAAGATTACYHGVGHGAVDGGDPRAWGNAQAMIAPGFEFCSAFAETDFQEYLCATGMFNAVEILSLDPKYGLEEFSQDPFSLCHGQEEKFREACYTNMIPAILRITAEDFVHAASMVEQDIESDPDYEIRNIVLSALFHEFIRINLAEPAALKEAVTLCQSLKEPLHFSCIDGLSGGHMKYGEPAKEYVKGLAFCASDLLLSEEKEVCYEHILSRLRIWYSKNQAQAICAGVKREYQTFCNFNDIIF